MTNNPTIDGVSRELRELLERVVGKPTGKPNWDALDEGRIAAAEELRALLEAPSCETCSDSGVVGNIMNSEPCPDCNAPAVERQEQSLKLCPRCANNGRSDDCPECHGRFMWYSKPPQEAYTEWYCRNPYESLTNSTVGWMAFKAGRDHASTGLQSTIAQLQARIAELESGRGEPLIHIAPEALAMLKGERRATHGGLTYSESKPLGNWTVPLFAAPPAPVAVVPDGWKLLPVEPTDDMIVAFAEAWYSKRQTIDDPDMLDAYRDMLASAPVCLDATAALNTVHVGELDPAQRLAMARGETK